jgi:hypothetical protein
VLVNGLVVAGIVAIWLGGMWTLDRVYAGLAGGIFSRALESRYGIDPKAKETQNAIWQHAGWTQAGYRPTSRCFIACHDNGLLLRARSPLGHSMSRTLLVPWDQVRVENVTLSLGMKERRVVVGDGGSPTDRVVLGSVPFSVWQRLRSQLSQ